MVQHYIHRGLINKNFQENTIKAFKHSFRRRYGIETDIHATKDHEFICFHDFTLNRIFKKKVSVKNIKYSQIKKISVQNKRPIPLLKDLLKASKNKYYLFIEIKPTFSKKLLQKLLKETYKFSKCVFISFRHENIHNLLKIKSNTKVGLSFSPPTTIKTIVKKSNNKKIDCLILDKFFLKNKIIQDLKIKKYYYTIKKKTEFSKYNKSYNLIFENL